MAANDTLENTLWESHVAEKGYFLTVSLAFSWVALSSLSHSHHGILLAPTEISLSIQSVTR